jgi:signal transduction histidine kinase/CheY-like chemotaxis protein/ABC-type amino acid transport substrate-binding protein
MLRSRFKKISVLVVSVAMFLAPLTAGPRRTVKVGVFPHVPAISMNAQGQAEGFYVDMLREVAAQENWDLIFVPGTWQEGLDRVRRGELDLITSVAKTPERTQLLDFGQQSSFTVWSILYAHPKVSINSILDVKNRRVAVMRGDVNGAHFRELCGNFNIACTFEEMGSFVEVMTSVAEGRADCGVTPSTFGYSRESTFKVERTPVVFNPFDIYFATRKGVNADLLSALDRYIQTGRGTPGSHYQQAIDRKLHPGQKTVLPPWAWKAGLSVLVLALGAMLTVAVFRKKVQVATAEIRELNSGLERELAEHKRHEEVILNISAGVSAATGESFLFELVRYLARATEADIAFVGEQQIDGREHYIHTLAVQTREGRGEPFTYNLSGTPCEKVFTGEMCIIPQGIQSQSGVGAIKALGIESYVGSPLMDSSGRMLGILAVMKKQVLENPAEIVALLKIFSTRAAAELERRRTEQERLQLERQVQHTQKLESLGVLAGGIAHDFNNLLTAMLGHMNVAQMKLAPGSPALSHLDCLEQIIHRAAELTRQMLAYSGKGRFVVRSYDINQVVQEMTHLLEVSISKKIALRFDLAENLPPVEADAAQIQQVIMNLVTNASDAIGDVPGTIRLVTRCLDLDRNYLNQVFQGQNLEPGSYVSLEVSDTGCGMTPDVQARIFEPFFTTKVTGRGLGLSATIGILKGHRSGMRIYSEPGRGTTFKLLFPSSLASVAEEKPEHVALPKLARKATVLLVDDEGMIRESGSAVLQALGLGVLLAADGREAVEVFTQNSDAVDLVLMDLTMPHMDGREAFHAIRKLRKEIPVILSSGYNEQESAHDFLGRDMTGFLQKPYTLHALEQMVMRVLVEKINQKPH